MKSKILLFIILVFYGQALVAQYNEKSIFFCGYEKSHSPSELCNFFQTNSFIDNNHANHAVDKILAPMGLPRNFVLVPCPNIENAVAVTPQNDGIRYIVYDNAFMEKIDRSTSDWSSLCILAHEIGHHLCGHTLRPARNLKEQQARELEADEWSGFVMYKLKASLPQAEAAVNRYATDEDDSYSTHPCRNRRLAEIEKGYNAAKGLDHFAKAENFNQESSPSAEKYYNEGMNLYHKDRYKEAIDQFTAASVINTSYVKAYQWRGYMQYKLKNFPAAMEDYNTAIKMDPQNASAYSDRAYLKYDGLKDYRGAILDYNKAIELNGNDSRPYCYRGDSKSYLGDHQGAMVDLNMAVSISPGDAFAYFCRGVEKSKIHDLSGAIADLNRALEIDPKDGIYHYLRGSYKRQSGDLTGACQDFVEGCSLGDSTYCCNEAKSCK